MKDKFIEEYIINPCTMFIEPETYGSKIYSRIYELEDELLVPFKPLEIVKSSCKFYGANYKGRIEGSHHLIGKMHKAPISIDPTLFFFPTTSPSRQDCIWVNTQLVANHHRYHSSITKVTFLNKKTYDILVSARTFKNQLLRSSLLKMRLMERTNENERMSYLYLYNPKYMAASESMDEYGKFTKRRNDRLSFK
ncbi:MAG TPA: competence protein ComK [Pseudoneobacillus sp.]|nr:competence protein ComK [Pseudoneobacillus sp.]